MIGPVAPIVPSQRTARLCAAILDRRDTVPAPPFSTAINSSPWLTFGTGPSAGRGKSPPDVFSPAENLRFSRVLRTRHVIPDVQQAVFPQPVRHHSAGIFMLEEAFGTTIMLSTGRVLPVRFIGEQHVLEDLGRIPTVQDWLGKIQPEPWMLGRGQALEACGRVSCGPARQGPPGAAEEE